MRSTGVDGGMIEIAVEAPLKKPLTYKFDQIHLPPQRGQRVNVPLGKRLAKGTVLGPARNSGDSKFEIKSIQSVDEEFPILPENYLNWLEWIAKYYLHPLGLVIESVFPPLERKTVTRASKRPPVIPVLEPKERPTLTAEQAQVLEQILSTDGFQTHLLHGVTGSGKTEVYLRLLEKTLQNSKNGLVLVPEISLTPQLIHRFAERFGDQVGVLHSQLTDRERTNQWWDIVSGKKKILIGARSALFCPVPNLGVIIVDEEHESSYKQDEKLKYHGRDCAVMLGRYMNCPVILGSATPSLESWKNALEGKYKLHQMLHRVGNRALPELRILDLKKTKKATFDIPGWMHQDLWQAMTEALGRKEQVALFLNRRGTSNMLLCPACGFVNDCPNCDISLTLHGRNHLVCHYCDYHETAKEICPECKEGEMTTFGVGTEQIENDIRNLFPEARIARADRDEIQNRVEMEDLITRMEKGEIDVLIGTQMIAKGLDFERLKLVGLILADVGFNLPDFRATERSFQLITQMAGRAGRHIQEGELPGQVLIQTLNPDHPSLSFALQQDFGHFAANELQIRMALNYPPYGRLASFRIQSISLQKVKSVARTLALRAQTLKAQNSRYANVEVLGPAEAPLAKLRGQYRYHLLIKTTSSQELNSFCQQLLGQEDWVTAGTRILVDIDPLHLL